MVEATADPSVPPQDQGMTLSVYMVRSQVGTWRPTRLAALHLSGMAEEIMAAAEDDLGRKIQKLMRAKDPAPAAPALWTPGGGDS